MEPVGAWESIIQTGPLFALMALGLWWFKTRDDARSEAEKKRQEENEKKEAAREERYNQLVDTLIKIQGEQNGAVIIALNASTNVMEEVKKKLNADDTYTRT